MQSNFMGTISNMLNFSELEDFLKKTGPALIALSIFLTVFMDILGASYLNVENIYHSITIFLLWFVILILSFFIMALSDKYKNLIVRALGIFIFIFPFFFYSFLLDKFQNNLMMGGYVVVMLCSSIVSIVLIDALFFFLQNKYFNKNYWFAIVCLVFAILMFFVIRYTVFIAFVTKLIPFSKIPDFLQVTFIGLEVGAFTGLVMGPAMVIIRKIFTNRKQNEN